MIKKDFGERAREQGDSPLFVSVVGALLPPTLSRQFLPRFLVNKGNWRSSVHALDLPEQSSQERQVRFPQGPAH